jgi:biotin operon repressor
MSEVPDTERTDQLIAFFKLFSDVERLKIAGLLAQGPRSIDDLAATLSLLRADVVHHLTRLAAAGLVAERSPGVYEFKDKALEAMAHRVLAGASQAPQVGDEDMDAFERKVVSDFLTADGRLKGLPSQYKKQLAVLRYVNRVFQPGARYTEKEVNAILSRFHEDTAALRRGLVDNRLMARQAGVYWQISGTTSEEPQ